MFVAVDGRPAGLVGVADPDQGDHARSHRGAAPGRHPGRDAHRRQPHDAEAVAKTVGIDSRSRASCRTRRRRSSSASRREGRRWRWPETASTTRPRSRRRDVGIAMGTGTDVAMESAGRYAGQRRSSGHRARAAASRATMRNIRQNLFFAFVYNVLGVPSRRGCLSALRAAAEPDDRERGDDVQFRVGHRQCASPEAGIPVTLTAPAPPPKGPSGLTS